MDLDAEATFLPEALSAPGAPGAPAASKPAPGWESYYGDLRKFVTRQLGGEQDADDVVQDIYRELLHSRCAEVTNPRAWLWKIAWRVVHDAFERRKSLRRHQINLDPESIEAIEVARLSPTSPVDLQLEAQDELLEALEGLPVATQIAIVRSRRDGWTYEQIAVELGVTPHMVKNHIGRAIAHFDEYFERRERGSTEQEVRK
jgi:RNA polymerase sigma factor (sigma-70 family)